MTATKPYSFIIRVALASRANQILKFHEANLTEHLWPRTLEDFKLLIADQALFEIVEVSGPSPRIAGLCYVMHGEEPVGSAERSEFGGVFVLSEFRPFGVAYPLGLLALAQHFLYDPPQGRLIAHVHEANTKPRRLLTEQLGFRHVGEEVPPTEIVPTSVQRNDRNEVVGHLFEFDRARLGMFANWIEEFSGQLEGKSGQISKLEIKLRLMKDRENAVAQLRAAAL